MRLALVALASLVAGAASTGLAAVAWEPSEAAVQVPVGRYGDTVTYATQWHQDATGRTRADLSGVTRWSVQDAREPDEAGQVFDGVRVQETFSTTDGTTSDSQSFVDLHLRALKRVDVTRTFEGAVEVGLPTNNNATLTLLGPAFGDGQGGMPDSRFATIADTPSSAATLFLLQGMRLAEGQVIDLEASGPAASQQRAREVAVTRVGMADGTAIAIVEVHETGVAKWVHAPRLQSTWEPRQDRYEWSLKVWMSEDSPYPLRIEETLRQVGTGDYGQATSLVRRTMSLVETKTGTRAIPWGSEAGSEPATPLDWMPGSMPSSEGWRGPMSLEAALAAASSPHLVAFADWKLNHPDHRLVGFYLQPVAPAMTPTLSLYFGAPSSTHLFYVTVEQQPGQSLVAREGGPEVDGITTHPLVQPHWHGADLRAQFAAAIELMPAQWPSLATLDERWRLVAAEEAFRDGPTGVQWGLQCACVLGEEELRKAITTIRYGRWVPAAATDSPFEHWGTWDHVFFDASSGDIKSSRSSTMAFQSPPVPATSAQVARAPSMQASDAPDIAPWVVGFSASILVALLLSWKMLRSAGLVLYARLLPAQLLSHPVRQQFLESIRASPGIGAPRLSQMHAVPWSTTMHHLRRMESAGYLTSERDGRHRRYFAAGKTDAQMRKVLAVIQNERTRHVLDLIRANPAGIDRTVLAAKCNVSVPGVLWHLDRLTSAGLIRSNRAGRVVLYFRNEGQLTTVGALEASPAVMT